MGKKQETALYNLLMQKITEMGKPEANPAQTYLSNEAMAGADFLKKGDYSQLPKGMFFDFKQPVEQLKQYQNLTNVGTQGNFALADNSGAGKAMAQQKMFLTDKFARDASQNYQDNIAHASDNVRGGLAQAAGAKDANNQNVIGALQGMVGKSPKGFNWQGLISGGLQAASMFI